MSEEHWAAARAVTAILAEASDDATGSSAVAILINASEQALDFHLPHEPGMEDWRLLFASQLGVPAQHGAGAWRLDSRSIACFGLGPACMQ